MNHSFDIEHAAMYGVTEAIMISNFEFWIGKNAANNRHIYDGKAWTYNSVKAFGELFPYLTPAQVRRAIDNLVLAGVLVRGNYNANTYDRTSWFAFGDDFPSNPHLAKTANGVGKNAPIHLAKTANGVGKKSKSLTGTDINADVNLLPSAPAAPLDEEMPADKPKKADKPAKVETPEDLALQAACRSTWGAYSKAYRIRYGADPVRNSKVNANVKSFVTRIGQGEAPSVAEFYVGRVNEQAVTRATHDFGLLLSRAESYRTQWATGRTSEESSPSAETAYQRSMRERVAEVAPAIARKAPGAPAPMQAVEFFNTVEAAPALRIGSHK